MWWISICLLSCLTATAVAQLYAGSYDCPGSWEGYRESCYKFDQMEKNLDGAIAECGKHQARLVSVNSEGEHLFIEAMLQRVDKKGKKWYTSGMRDAQNRNHFTWQAGDGKDVEGAEFWLKPPEELAQEEGDRITYETRDLVQWKWFLAKSDEILPFICEIPKDESYNIVEQERDFGYGISETDPSKFEIGPHFTVEPSDVLYDVNDIAGVTSIFCKAIGNPEPEYNWYFTKQAIRTKIDPSKKENKRYTISTGALIISDPQDTQDNGDYDCVARNKYGSILSRTVQLLFTYLPDFPKSERDPVIVTAYSGIGIECNPPEHGYPSLSYSWYKDDITNFVRPELKPYIFISSNGKLYFSSVTRDDKGYYHCLISPPNKDVLRGEGKVSMPTFLDVKETIGREEEPKMASGFPAVFPSSPKRGDNVRIECFAYGTDDLDYSWERIGESMPRQAKLADHNRVLNIPNIQLTHSGTYRCRVERRNGQTAIGVVEVPVESPPFFIIPLKDQHADKNSNLTWQCNGDGKPEVHYKWYLNASLLVPNKLPEESRNRFQIVGEKSSTLMINPVMEMDAGMYQCAAINTHGTTFSSAQLRVLSLAPTFEKFPLPPNQYGTLNSQVTLICNPEAAPRATLAWNKDGRRLALTPGDTSSRVRMLTNGFLHIDSIRSTDAGNYTCIAENEHGKAESTGQLSILGSTKLKQHPRHTTVQVNQTAFFHCEAAFNPVLDVTYDWYHNNRKLDFIRIYTDGSTKVWIEKEPYFERGTGINKGGLYIRDVQFYHQGNYTCVAKTSSEENRHSALLTVTGPPSEPAGLVGNSPTNTTIQLSWIPGKDNGKDIIAYYVEAFDEYEKYWKRITSPLDRRKISDFKHPSAKITGLSPFSSYMFRVRAENVYGIGDPSDPTPVYKTLPAPPLTAPTNVGGGGGKVGLLTITWDPLPPNKWNGGNVGYYVKNKKAFMEDEEWDIHRLEGPHHNRFTITVGQSNYYKEYDVAVQAFNNEGDSPVTSEVVTIRSAEGLPTGVPTNARAYNYNGTALLVEWDPVEDVVEVMKGILKGYRINYWIEDQEEETMAQFNPILGQTDHGLVIGLYPWTYYVINVQVYNEAGVGPKSTNFVQQTLRSPPLEAPQEVHVFPKSYSSIYVEWRGVSTGIDEEPLEGYKVRIWLQGEDLKVARDFDAMKKTYADIHELEPKVVYNLRVFGYSRGGQGLMSSPTIQFILGPNCKVKEEYPEKEYTYMCGPRENYSDTAAMQSPNLLILIVSLLLSYNRYSS